MYVNQLTQSAISLHHINIMCKCEVRKVNSKNYGKNIMRLLLLNSKSLNQRSHLCGASGLLLL